jgi:hypothetical protein
MAGFLPRYLAVCGRLHEEGVNQKRFASWSYTRRYPFMRSMPRIMAGGPPRRNVPKTGRSMTLASACLTVIPANRTGPMGPTRDTVPLDLIPNIKSASRNAGEEGSMCAAAAKLGLIRVSREPVSKYAVPSTEPTVTGSVSCVPSVTDPPWTTTESLGTIACTSTGLGGISTVRHGKSNMVIVPSIRSLPATPACRPASWRLARPSATIL